jgi:hypothetical protein
MKNDGQTFLEELGHCPPNTFERRFSVVSGKLGLGTTWERNELQLLYEATLSATRCNLMFNDAGAPAGKTGRPHNESNRTRLERDFMAACDILFASPGWQALSEARQKLLRTIFLGVCVTDQNLAP